MCRERCFLRQTAACVYLYGGFTANIWISWHLPVHVFIYVTIWTHLSYRCMHVLRLISEVALGVNFLNFFWKVYSEHISTNLNCSLSLSSFLSLLFNFQSPKIQNLF